MDFQQQDYYDFLKKELSSSFGQGLAHGLTNKLTSLLGFSDFALSSKDPDGMTQALKKGIGLSEDCSRQLQRFQYSCGLLQLGRQNHSLRDLTKSLVDSLRYALEKSALELTVNIPASVSVSTEIGLLSTLLGSSLAEIIELDRQGGRFNVSMEGNTLRLSKSPALADLKFKVPREGLLRALSSHLGIGYEVSHDAKNAEWSLYLNLDEVLRKS